MKDQEKNKLLDAAKAHIASVRSRIKESAKRQEEKSASMAKAAVHMLRGDAIAQYKLAAHREEAAENLKQLYPSPYFTRCDFETNGEKKTMYFGKFSLSEEGIYSWITPAATLRFENLGRVSYTRPDGSEQVGIVDRKDQYMIVDGKLLFFSTEGIDCPRELIHQENFTRHKTGFILPEVVEQMEKAQDQVIRAPFYGPFVISGPAGSGKTTLALHRVAYLMQSPETAEFFQPHDILVLVQDSGTKEYFSHLLPDLGIQGVTILTFADWVWQILKLDGYVYRSDHSEDESERMLYEYAKLEAVRGTSDVEYNKNNYVFLKKSYAAYFTPAQEKIFEAQKNKKSLDRFDVTLLLCAYQKKYGNFTIEKEYYEELAGNRFRKKTSAFPVQYNLMIIDEFQNYLPEQLQLLQSCINKRLESLVYVGDMAQQTQIGTVRNWSSIGGGVDDGRRVQLQKVYRNTKEILEYIRTLGYQVEIPVQIKSGEAVQVVSTKSVEEVLMYVNSYVAAGNDLTFGILAREKTSLQLYKDKLKGNANVHCLSFYEAQGVEFDTVFIVGGIELPKPNPDYPAVLQNELAAVERDLLYVALTRPMGSLHILN